PASATATTARNSFIPALLRVQFYHRRDSLKSCLLPRPLTSLRSRLDIGRDQGRDDAQALQLRSDGQFAETHADAVREVRARSGLHRPPPRSGKVRAPQRLVQGDQPAWASPGARRRRPYRDREPLQL